MSAIQNSYLGLLFGSKKNPFNFSFFYSSFSVLVFFLSYKSSSSDKSYSFLFSCFSVSLVDGYSLLSLTSFLSFLKNFSNPFDTFLPYYSLSSSSLLKLIICLFCISYSYVSLNYLSYEKSILGIF